MLGKRRESTELLLDHGADPNYAVKHITPLISAVIEHDLPLVRLLLAHGAKVNTKMPNGNTALRLARREHDSDIERLLLKAGAKE
jgi:ankyrin repeat protein